MRTFTFLILALFASFSVNAQLFLIDSPASVAGSYQFSETVDYGANLLDSIWCGELLLADDGADPSSDGCTPLVNDMTGKIAVIDRGTCNFSLKSYHAQEAGAVALIIVNIEAGNLLVGMLGGDSATAVVIPTIFITLEDGDVIKTAMASDVVSACMGNIIFENDISTSFDDTRVPFYGTVPANQITEASIYSELIPSALVTNNGSVDQPNVNLDVTVDFAPFGGSGSEVYNQSATESLLAADTSFLAELPAYDYTGSDPGIYTITYTIESDSVDQSTFDNEVINSFAVSENAYSRSNWDEANNRPVRGGVITPAFADGEVTSFELISPFFIPNGAGKQVDSISFFVQTNDDGLTLDGISVTTNIYTWDDANNDSLYQNTEIVRVGSGNANFAGSTDLTAWVTVYPIDIISTDIGVPIADDTYYLVGQRFEDSGANRTVFFGANDNFGQALNLGPAPTQADLPYWITTDFLSSIPDMEMGGLFSGPFFTTLATAMYVNETPIIESAKDLLSEIDASLDLYPNPVSDLLTADVTLSEITADLTYKITDATGRLIFSTQVENVKTDKAEFNVAQLPTGQYFMTIQTEKGTRTESFNVNR